MNHAGRLGAGGFAAFLFTMVLVLGQGAVSGTASANTPDGETPANEGVCDILQGGTPGLYGLCVAYCEAQDLDLVGNKEPPNNKILANYRKKMQPGDPDMPCVKVPCPCWTEAELADITARIAGGDSSFCASDATTAQIRNTTNLQFATIDIGRQPALCGYTDTTVVPRLSRRFEIDSPEVAQSCYTQVIAACASLGY
ncbi:MAG: hypothetical protein LOY58_13365 [Gammaproteobacteria bacterium]|jgi:hypothetical protein|nr:hypothetical protein [Gammaproteobacteria bacterium]